MAEDSIVSEVTSDDEAQQALVEIEGDCSDSGLCIDDVDYAKALEIVGTMQERVNNLHAYLSGKAKE